MWRRWRSGIVSRASHRGKHTVVRFVREARARVCVVMPVRVCVVVRVRAVSYGFIHTRRRRRRCVGRLAPTAAAAVTITTTIIIITITTITIVIVVVVVVRMTRAYINNCALASTLPS